MFRRLLVTDVMNNLTLISFSIFFLVFLLTAAWAFLMPKKHVNHLSNLPLESDEDENE